MTRDPMAPRLFASLLFAAVLTTAGCHSIGPRVIPRDRVDYREALSVSWKTQTLSNLVRLRYADPPIFLDVASIVNSYSLQAGATVGANFGPSVDTVNSVGAVGVYTDRPTITYSPVTGDKFTRSVMTPLTPDSALSLVQAGYPVDAVFRICVKSIIGVSNQSGAYSLRRPADPSFVPLLEAMRRIQSSGAVGLRLEKRGGGEVALLVLRKGGSTEVEADRRRVKEILGLQEADEFSLVLGFLPRGAGEIAMVTRSMLEIMGEIASGIDVPEKDIEEQRVNPPVVFENSPGTTLPPLLHVRCTTEQLADAYVAVNYRRKWFWIDDRDMPSKRLFSFMMLLFSLAETGDRATPPVLTIPAG